LITLYMKASCGHEILTYTTLGGSTHRPVSEGKGSTLSELEVDTFVYSYGNRYSLRVYSVSKSVEVCNINSDSAQISATDCSL
jgi:hypothetical protein